MGWNVTTEIGDFLGSFVDEQCNQLHVGVVVLDPEGDVLQKDRLACLGWCDDQSTGTETDRAEHVDEPACGWTPVVFQVHSWLRIDCGQVLEPLATGEFISRNALDLDDLLGHSADRSTATTTSTPFRLAFDHLHGHLECRSEFGHFLETQGNEGVVLGFDQTITKLSQAGICTVLKLEYSAGLGHSRGCPRTSQMN